MMHRRTSVEKCDGSTAYERVHISEGGPQLLLDVAICDAIRKSHKNDAICSDVVSSLGSRLPGLYLGNWQYGIARPALLLREP